MGEEISKRGYESFYGSNFYERLSADIRKELPDATGFSPTSLHCMRWFCDRYSPLFGNLRQLAVEFDSDMASPVKAASGELNLRQLAVELFSIPWGHHQAIIGKCSSLEESVFYVHETATNGWSVSIIIYGYDLSMTMEDFRLIGRREECLELERCHRRNGILF